MILLIDEYGTTINGLLQYLQRYFMFRLIGVGNDWSGEILKNMKNVA